MNGAVTEIVGVNTSEKSALHAAKYTPLTRKSAVAVGESATGVSSPTMRPSFTSHCTPVKPTVMVGVIVASKFRYTTSKTG